VKRVLLASLVALVAACEPQLPTQPTTPTGETSGPTRAEFRPIRLEDKESTAVVGTLDKAAVDYVDARRALLGLSDGDDMVVLGAPKTSGTLSHVRLQQQYLGVPVVGSDVVVHASGTTFKTVSGALTVGLEGFDVNPSVTEDEALFSGKADYAALAKSMPSELVYERESSTLVIYPGDSGVRLAWHVVFFTELQNDVNPGLWNYFVDAKTGAFLAKFNAIHTLSQASGAGGNAKVSRTWSSALDVEPSGSAYKMDTARLITVNMNNSQSGSGTVVTGSLSSIGDAAINDAHGFAEATLNMLTQWFGYNSINNSGFKVKSRVHYGSNYENAFWDGTQMTYGDGASFFYPLSGDVDVVSHEIHHGFTTFHSNLTYSGMSGGINESFSDVAGTAAEFFSEGTGADWDLGKDIFKQSGALRYMCDPTMDGSSIGHASKRRTSRTAWTCTSRPACSTRRSAARLAASRAARPPAPRPSTA
jgi:vibriolysin